jgi:membrane-bound lytic murein transglycosylase C
MLRLIALALLLALAAKPRAQDFDELDRESGKAPENATEAAERMREQVEGASRRMDADISASQRAQAEDAERLSVQLQAQYDEYLRSLQRQREQLRAMVIRQWEDFQESTPKTWVQYSKKGDALSKVDFEQGKVVIEALVPLEEVTSGEKPRAKSGGLDAAERDKARRLGEEKLALQARKALTEKDSRGTPVLQGQLKDANVERAIAPKLQLDETPFVAEDGKPRLRVRVELELVPEHLKIRAKRHAGRIAEAARKYGLDPALVYAVIHTESEFNPRARSQAPAFGLMQLMPKTAAREAFQYLYKQDKILPPDYLYDPDNNILLGATYLHLLRTRHYGKVKDADNQRALMIAAYNCGPGCVRRSVLSKGDPDSLSHEQLVSIIRRSAPKETAAYVPRVEGRLGIYRGF